MCDAGVLPEKAIRIRYTRLGTSMAARDVNSRRSVWAPSWEEEKAATGDDTNGLTRWEAAKEEQILHHHCGQYSEQNSSGDLLIVSST
jgi:hypothetical protein